VLNSVLKARAADLIHDKVADIEQCFVIVDWIVLQTPMMQSNKSASVM